MTTTVEELRKNLIAELGAFQLTMFGTDRAEEEVDAIINAVELRMEMKCKEALMAQSAECVKECARQSITVETGIIQAERRRILDNSLFQFGMGEGTYMMIRTSVVDPKESANGNS